MGKLKDHFQEFLDGGGSKLGFSMGLLPHIDDVRDVLVNDMDAQTYLELKKECEKEYE